MYYQSEIINQAYFNGIVKRVDKAVTSLIVSKRDLSEEYLVPWRDDVSEWFYHRLYPTSRNHRFRDWFIYRSVFQMTNFDAFETACLHLALQKHPSAVITPERLVADKRCVLSPDMGWQRFWHQERRLQASVAQLIEERGWCVDPQDSIIYGKDLLFAGRMMQDDSGRVLVAIPGKDTDHFSGVIGPIDARQLSLALHDARHYFPVQVGGLLTMDPQTLAVKWHEGVYDAQLGQELAALRSDFWSRHVIEEEPLPDQEPSKISGSTQDSLARCTPEQVNGLQFAIMQYCLAKELLAYSSHYRQVCRELLVSFLTELSLRPSTYKIGDCGLTYRLTRDPARIRKALLSYKIPLDDIRGPLNPGEEGEFNRLGMQAMLAELEVLLAAGDKQALMEGVERLLQLPLELGPIDMKKATALLGKTSLVSPQELHRERIETEVTHVMWDQETRSMKDRLEAFIEEQSLALHASLIAEGEESLNKIEK